MEQIPKEYRCNQCNKLLFKGALLDAMVEIKCRGCKVINSIKGSSCSFTMVNDGAKGIYKPAIEDTKPVQ